MDKSQKHHVDWEKQVTEVFVEYFAMYIKFERFKTVLHDVWEFVNIIKVYREVTTGVTVRVGNKEGPWRASSGNMLRF